MTAQASDMYRTLDEADARGKRVLVRVDLNVPVENGKVGDTTRLEGEAPPTCESARVADTPRTERVAPPTREIADKGGKVFLPPICGRPKGPDPKQSLKPF